MKTFALVGRSNFGKYFVFCFLEESRTSIFALEICWPLGVRTFQVWGSLQQTHFATAHRPVSSISVNRNKNISHLHLSEHQKFPIWNKDTICTVNFWFKEVRFKEVFWFKQEFHFSKVKKKTKWCLIRNIFDLRKILAVP